MFGRGSEFQFEASEPSVRQHLTPQRHVWHLCMLQVGRLLSNLKTVQLEMSLDSKVFALKSRVFGIWIAPKSRVFALLGAKALDFGAKALDFFDVLAKNLVNFRVA